MSDLLTYLRAGYEGNSTMLGTLQYIAQLTRPQAAEFCCVSPETYRRWRSDRTAGNATLRLLSIRAGVMPWPEWKNFYYCAFDGRIYHEDLRDGAAAADVKQLPILRAELYAMRVELESLRAERDDLKWLSVFQGKMLDCEGKDIPTNLDLGLRMAANDGDGGQCPPSDHQPVPVLAGPAGTSVEAPTETVSKEPAAVAHGAALPFARSRLPAQSEKVGSFRATYHAIDKPKEAAPAAPLPRTPVTTLVITGESNQPKYYTHMSECRRRSRPANTALPGFHRRPKATEGKGRRAPLPKLGVEQTMAAVLIEMDQAPSTSGIFPEPDEAGFRFESARV